MPVRNQDRAIRRVGARSELSRFRVRPVPTATEWCDDLKDAIRDYTRTRRRTPAVQVTLVSDERFYLFNATAVGSLVALSPYPKEREAEIIHDADGVTDYTPRVLLTDPNRIAKVELLYDAPAHQAIGFGIRPDA